MSRNINMNEIEEETKYCPLVGSSVFNAALKISTVQILSSNNVLGVSNVMMDQRWPTTECHQWPTTRMSGS